MRRLLIAAAVLLAGHAHALDYVQCQAMQRTIWQLEEDSRRAKNGAESDAKRNYLLEDCGKPPFEFRNSVFQKYSQTYLDQKAEWDRCELESIRINRTRVEQAVRNNPDVIRTSTRLQKVRKDFAASCY